MTPTLQTKFGSEGNCFDACVATLLDLPLDDVNYFRSEETWYADFQNWLAPRGLAYVEIDCRDCNPFFRFPLPVLAIGSGKSPRFDDLHAVVIELRGWEKKIVHDPHPDGTGIPKIDTVGLFVRKF